MDTPLLITHGMLITWDIPNQILPDHAIYISDGIVQQIGPSDALEAKHPLIRQLDARGQLVMPGNINAHNHFYSALSCGVQTPGDVPFTLPTILERIWWPFDLALRQEEVYYSAMVGIIDAIRHGTTTLFDHQSSPNYNDGVLDMIASAIEEGGLRAVLSFEVTDRNGPELAKAGIQENIRFIQRCKREEVAGGRIAANFGIHAPMTVSDATLSTCREAAPEDIGFHLHVGEHVYDQVRSLAMTGSRSIDRLHKHNMLNDRTILAHAIHLDSREVNLVAEAGTWISHQPRSNMATGAGVAEVESYLRCGVRVCLGNDGLLNTMWQEAQTAFFLQKIHFRDARRLPEQQLVEMAVYNNAALASLYFPKARVGVIKPGSFADLIFVDYQPATPLSVDNLASHIIYRFCESMITSTIVQGRVLMQDRVLLMLDEPRIKARAREIVPEFWKRYQRLVPTGPILG